MSPLSRDRLLVRFAPSGLARVRLHGLLRPRIVARDEFACESAGEAEPWRGPLAAFGASLAALRAESIDLTVVLSNHFVRYALLPWSSALRGAAEEQAYLRHHFVRIYGERAKSWVLRASAAPSEAPRLASAVDAALLDALVASLPKSGALRLRSVQPYLMAAFNRWQSSLATANAWLLLLEPGRACLTLHSAGRWRSVQCARGVFASPAELAALLDRQRYQVEGKVPDRVLYLTDSQRGDPPQAPGWKLQPLSQSEGRYAPALAAA